MARQGKPTPRPPRARRKQPPSRPRERQPVRVTLPTIPRPKPRQRAPQAPQRPVLRRPQRKPREPQPVVHHPPHNRPVNLPKRPKGAARVANVAGAGITAREYTRLYGNTAANTARCIVIATTIETRFPGVWNPAKPNIVNCRPARGDGHGNFYSVHSVGGAVDIGVGGFAGHDPAQVEAFARTLPGVNSAYRDYINGSLVDVHVQIIPNPPDGWVAPCAGGPGTPGPGTPPPATDALWNLLISVGFSNTLKVPGEPHGLSALEMAWCIAKAESGGDMSPGGNLFQFTNAPPRTARANAFRAWTESGLGTVWVAWCTAFGGPRVNPRPGVPGGSKANCGHNGPNYLKTTQGIDPAYFQFVSALPSGVPAGGGRGGGRETSGNATPDIRTAGLGLYASCADKMSNKQLQAQLFSGIGHIGSPRENLAGSLCSVPVFGTVSCGIASFMAKLPQYLKIAAGGTVMIGGLVLVVAGATGNTARVPRPIARTYRRVTTARATRAAGQEARRSAATKETRTAEIHRERLRGMRARNDIAADEAAQRKAVAEQFAERESSGRNRPAGSGQVPHIASGMGSRRRRG